MKSLNRPGKGRVSFVLNDFANSRGHFCGRFALPTDDHSFNCRYPVGRGGTLIDTFLHPSKLFVKERQVEARFQVLSGDCEHHDGNC